MTSSYFEVADVIRQFGEAYIKRYPNILPSQRRALSDISDCMTTAMGGSMYNCDDCGESFWRFHVCGNRSCPKCGGLKRSILGEIGWCRNRATKHRFVSRFTTSTSAFIDAIDALSPSFINIYESDRGAVCPLCFKKRIFTSSAPILGRNTTGCP